MSSRKKAKKESEDSSKNQWECPEQCPNWDKTPCKHLEAELAKGTRSNSVGAISRGDIDGFVEQKYSKVDVNSPVTDLNGLDPFQVIIPDHIKNRTYEKSLRLKLKRAGLTLLDRDVVVMKFVYEMNLQEIAEELGITSLQTTHNILVKALKRLKDRGFGKR
jgi:DNA-directed RNA polymerase specialized sigma24 family protein